MLHNRGNYRSGIMTPVSIGEPKYVLVVFQEGGRAGGQTPASVFRAISEAVYCTENPGPADYGG